LPMFLHPQIPKPQQLDGFLYKAFLNWMIPVAGNFTVIYSVIAFSLLFIQALSLNMLVNSQRLMEKPNYLTGMCYLLFTSLFTDWYYLSSPLIINTLLISVLFLLCNLHNNNLVIKHRYHNRSCNISLFPVNCICLTDHCRSWNYKAL
jgi:hypothetical protein